MSLFDSMKDKVSAAGKGAKKLTRLGQLRLDLKRAENELARCHEALGRTCAAHLIERAAPSVDAAEEAIAGHLGRIREARARIDRLRQALSP